MNLIGCLVSMFNNLTEAACALLDVAGPADASASSSAWCHGGNKDSRTQTGSASVVLLNSTVTKRSLPIQTEL